MVTADDRREMRRTHTLGVRVKLSVRTDPALRSATEVRGNVLCERAGDKDPRETTSRPQ